MASPESERPSVRASERPSTATVDASRRRRLYALERPRARRPNARRDADGRASRAMRPRKDARKFPRTQRATGRECDGRKHSLRSRHVDRGACRPRRSRSIGFARSNATMRRCVDASRATDARDENELERTNSNERTRRTVVRDDDDASMCDAVHRALTPARPSVDVIGARNVARSRGRRSRA